MATKQTTPTPPTPVKRVTREGFTLHTGDVVGFHDPEFQGPICGIPRAAKASDSQLDSKKASMFVIFELLEDCKATEGSGEDAIEITAKKGEMVGVWLKGGMRQIRNLGGVPVLLQYTGEKKLKGKPAAFNPMKTYDFDVGGKGAGAGTLIPVIEDNRKDSRYEDLPCGFGVGADPSKQADAADSGF